ncbi:DUF2971 domain-containing protein [Candidatus Neomarinimicrobiota bacterium]
MVYKSIAQWWLNPSYLTPELQLVIKSYHDDWLEEQIIDDGMLLHHYTTLEGMRSIIETRNLWCGHVSAFNDPSEIQYGKDLILDVLRQLKTKLEQRDLGVFLDGLITYIRAFGKTMYHPFAACFCESGNLLSQWRAYADRGGGYCLGLEFTPGTRIASDTESLSEGNPPFIRKVIYDEKQQRELVLAYIESVVKAAEDVLAGGGTPAGLDKSTHLNMMAMQAVNPLFDMLITFKSSVFKEEQEWRLVRTTMEYHQADKIEFRESTGGLIPYRPTYIYNIEQSESPQFPLRSICFGPTLDPIQNRSAIELFLHNIATDDHPIKLIPSNVQIKVPGYSLR